MDSDLEFTCPCCKSTLGLDDAGDLFAITDTREGKVGINGLRTHTVSGNNWQAERYLATEPQRYTPPSFMVDHQQATQPLIDQTDEDDNTDDILSSTAVMAAHQKDLKTRNIN